MPDRDLAPLHDAEDLFAGPGPARAALRAVDWAATPLGPVVQWPLDLVCAARTVACASAPMALWWGDEFHQFHNDALSDALGGDAPAVGRPAADCWPERWEVLEPSVSRTIKLGESVYLDDVVLPIGGEPTSFWTFSVAPLLDDAGRAAGALANACDLTARVAAQELERRSADAANANLQIALASNRRIGIAVGILMALRRITDAAAFDLLRDASQHSHRKLREIAEDVILTGDIGPA